MKYYTDGVTKVTDGLYVCRCEKGHLYWSCTYVKRCCMCKEKVTCIPAAEWPDSKKGVS